MNIIAVTSMKNEGPHLIEWIAHHLAIGVGHFLIYSNDCSDGTDLMLDELAGAGLVTHVRQTSGGERPVQWTALKHASDHPLVRDADWVIVLDCDEFINLNAPVDDLAVLIAAMPESAEAIAMRWRLFGYSGHIEMADVMTTEVFTGAAPLNIDLPLAHFFKSMFRPGAFRGLGVHRPKQRKRRGTCLVRRWRKPVGS